MKEDWRQSTRILWMSDAIYINSGFALVGREILSRLHNYGYPIETVGWCFDWRLAKNYPELCKKIKIYPGEDVRYPQHKFGSATLGPAIQEVRPKVLITLGDEWMINYVPKLLDSLPKEMRPIWLSYFPIDGCPIPESWIKTFKAADVPITYSIFGQTIVFLTSNRTLMPRMIYHGVNPEVFKPLDKEKLKANAGMSGKFIVGCNHRNQPRKNVPYLIKIFAEFAKDKDNVLLYLHMAPKDMGWDLIPLLKRYRIEKITYLTRKVGPAEGVPQEKLNELMNLWDVHCTLTQGEGFGLSTLETMSAGIPNIATNYTSNVELVKDRGELVDCDYITGKYNIERALPKIPDAVAKLNKLYHNPKLVKEYSKKCREFALTMTWDRFGEEWDRLIQEVVG